MSDAGESRPMREKYMLSQAECRKLKEKLTETEAELKNLQNFLEPAVDEFGQLQKRYEIERGCRSEAERYARKMRKQNVDLKRRSQQLLERMQTVDISIDDVDGDVSDVSGDELDSEKSETAKIQILEESLRKAEEELLRVESEKLDAYKRETTLTAKIESLEDELAESKQMVEDYHQEMKKIRRVSDAAWLEFEQLKLEHQRLIMLQAEAEKYAQQMQAERDAMKHESALLISSAVTDSRLASALTSIEELTCQLSMQQNDYQRQIEALRKELDNSELQQQVNDLELKLNLAASENDRLQRAIKELEKWKLKLEKENVDLVNKLDVAEQKLRPPPPPPAPPPPPPSLLSPLKLLIKKKSPSASGGNKSDNTKTGTPRDKTYEEALKEMMERIKSGRTLKPVAANEQFDGKEASEMSNPTAMNNLQNLLNGRKCSMDDVIARQKVERHQQHLSHDGTNETAKSTTEVNELQQAFKKICRKSRQGDDETQ